MKTSIFRKLYLLLWKNLVLLKRQYIVTACEIILPTLFTIALAYIRTKIVPFDDGFPPTDNFFEEYNKQALLSPLQSSLLYGYGRTPIIGFTCNPKIQGGRQIMEKFLDLLKPDPNIPFKGQGLHQEVEANITEFATEADMEAFQLQFGQASSSGEMSNSTFVFGIVFNGLSDDQPQRNQKISYKIRLANGYFYNTKDLFPYSFTPGPGYGYSEYMYSSFSGIQFLIDSILIERFSGSAPVHEISMQPFPYPAYKQMDIDDLYYIFLPQFIVLGLVFIVPSVVRGAVSEKETGIKELMKMSGLPEWMHWVGWMLNSLIVLTITMTIIVLLLFVSFNSETGAVLKNSDPTLVWVVLMIYAVWATTYCFSVSAFFEKPTLATTVGIVLWLVSFYGLGLAMEESYGQNLAVGVKLLLCLFPNVAIHLALKVICTFEAEGKGAKWGNMAEPLSAANSLTLLYVVLMFLASICLNMLICLYVEAVLPKKYGVRKPFYYIFLPSEWGFGRSKENSSYFEKSDDAGNNKPGFEEEPAGIKAGVEIRKLRKEFGKSKVAVNDMSVNILEGQIFCLLGENGAGKTTTMSILTGLFSATSGTALINGYDIRTDMERIRQNLGLCPQHNMLFDKLTVHEHLKFFGMLKGLSAKEASVEAKDLIRTLRIEEKMENLSVSLSGGQKRRLSLGCALIGGSRVIFLDEPTSGMDPEARRAIWDILLRIRGERTIVLTTHFMEEADVLGDRIAIMASGVLQCCGSPSFLKRFYGAGYTLAMTINPEAKQEPILNAIKEHIADAHFKDSFSNNASELAVILPSDSNTSSKFPNLFADLTSKQAELGIREVGVGWTTMDEVFVRVEELSHKSVEGSETDSQSDDTNAGSNDEILSPSVKSSGANLLLGQFIGLFMKKLVYSFRRKRLVLSQMVIPILLIIAAVSISNAIVSVKSLTQPLNITISSYKDPVTIYHSSNEDQGRVYARTVGNSARKLEPKFNGNVTTGLLDVGKRDLPYFREKHIIAAEMNDTHMKAMFSTIALHSAPLSMSVLSNTILQLNSPNQGYAIETINHPFPNGYYDLFKPAEGNPEFTIIIAIIFGVLVPIGLALLAASFIVAPTEERLSQGKQLQIMTGVNPTLYWCSMYFCDYFLMLVTICLMTACIPIFESNKSFTNNDGAGVIFLIMAVYGLATISFSYIFSTFVRSVAGGFSILTILHLLTGIGLGVGSFILEATDNPQPGIANVINSLGRIFPTFGVTRGAIQYAKVASTNSKCYALTKEAKDILCSPSFDVDQFSYMQISQECCENCKDLKYGVCFEPEPYFSWTRELVKENWDILDYLGNPTLEYFYIPGVTQDIVWLALIAVVYFVVLMLVEYDVFKLIWEKIFKSSKSTFQSTVSDNDVLEENRRVQALVNEHRTSENAMVVSELCKSFGMFSAVSKMNFGVFHGECFGLLGVNGAGKSTTFKMLTGDETRSNGNAYIGSLSLFNGRKEFLSKIGYCPQFDGIIGVLTGKEMLTLFARLRGIPATALNGEVEKWLRKTGLSGSGDVLCAKYSGGMKRRLSAAMALIGDPPVVLLDEPTSGVDPVARRQFWKIISSIKNSGQAIVLTSHSMEECEVLCSRLGIMVNGEMQCLGGVQHLKNKFAQGYSLTIKLKPVCLQQPPVVDNITQSVCSLFQPCSLKDYHQTTMKFLIQSQSRLWEELYRSMESLKDHFKDYIEEYAITETTLEEVFLSFARKQYADERTTSGFTMCGCTFRMC